jgi:hypothetical protein
VVREVPCVCCKKRNIWHLANMATLCGEVPQEWKSYWESRELLRGMRTYISN